MHEKIIVVFILIILIVPILHSCDKTLANENIDEPIQEAMDFFHGKVKSYDFNTGSCVESFRDGKRKYLTLSPYIKNIVTDKNIKYEILN